MGFLSGFLLNLKLIVQLKQDKGRLHLKKLRLYPKPLTNRIEHNEENVRFFICKLLDFGLSLLESPQI